MKELKKLIINNYLKGEEMKLNIQERLTLVNVVPEKANFDTMSIIEGLKLLLYPSEAEVKKFEIKQDGKTLYWNAEGSKKIDIKLTEGQRNLLLKQLNSLSERDDLDFNQYSVLKRFREEKE